MALNFSCWRYCVKVSWINDVLFLFFGGGVPTYSHRLENFNPTMITTEEWFKINGTNKILRECPRRPREITKMWHMLEKLISLIICSEIPHDVLINVVYLFYSDLLLFSKKLEKSYMSPTTTKWRTSKGRVSTQELHSWKVQKQVRVFFFLVYLCGRYWHII